MVLKDSSTTDEAGLSLIQESCSTKASTFSPLQTRDDLD